MFSKNIEHLHRKGIQGSFWQCKSEIQLCLKAFFISWQILHVLYTFSKSYCQKINNLIKTKPEKL